MLPVLLAAAAAVPAAAKAAAPAAATTVVKGKAGAAAAASPLTNFTFDTTPHSWLASHAGWLTHTFAGLFVIAGVLLIFLLAVQTTKQEGLGGTVGGRVESATRRLGLDAQIARVTGTVAVAFVVLATMISLAGI